MNVIEELGSDAVVPKEPRTQDHWTRPSHASTLTGVHPAEHGYVAGAGDDVEINRISENLTTLAEFLCERMYQCPGCVSQSSLSGSYGFAQGFHRYELCNMSWETRENDAKQVVNKGLEWINDDADTGSERIFHFVHFFDAHYPYIPPYHIRDQTEICVNLPNCYKNRRVGKDYLETVRNSPPEVPLEEQQTILEYYTQSLQFTARQVQRYIKELENLNLYKEAFIAILGDHGKGFYDRKLATHSTLYDENIRPGCILELPAMVDFSVPDEIDYIDLLPTVARMLNEKPPGQYSGQAWQSCSSCSSPRITERIRPDSYSVAVEINGKKGIFTYSSEFPELPKSSVISNGPIETEFYDLSSIRKNRTNEYNDLSAAVKSKLLNKAKNSASLDVSVNIEMASVQPSKATEKRLEKLGYK